MDLGKVEKFQKRNRIQHTKQLINLQRIQESYNADHDEIYQSLSFLRAQPIGLISKTPPRSPPQRPLSSPQVWKIPENLMYHIGIYINGSFECGKWYFISNERLIESSEHQAVEKTSIMSFLEGLDTGCRYFTEGKADMGGLYWRKAFREIETLVQGSYHDIIPNMIFKINDLDDNGYREVAKMMRKYAVQCCLASQYPSHARTTIFRALADADMDQMKELELMIMTCFVRLFELYVGPRCYSTFVMEMDLARRRLLRGEPVDRCLPVVSNLDTLFGPLNHRSLDAIRLRIEFWFQRKEYTKVGEHASLLIERASTVEGDTWRRFYFLVKGGYHLGITQYHQAKYTDALQTLSNCLQWEAEFWTVDKSGQFNPEKVEMLESLEAIALWNGQVGEAVTWRSQRLLMLERIKAMDMLCSSIPGS